jgi:arsenate reductase
MPSTKGRHELTAESENPRVYNVLFLCTGNSARSIMAEALLPHRGGGRFRAFSAGSYPTGRVNPLALQMLEAMHLPTDGFRSKSWDEFSQPGAPVMDFIITVCDQAAGEVCPIWPGHPMTAHWGVPDPAAVEGSDETRLQAFREAFHLLDQRITLFTNLNVDALDRLALQGKVDEIGGARHSPPPV